MFSLSLTSLKRLSGITRDFLQRIGEKLVQKTSPSASPLVSSLEMDPSPAGKPRRNKYAYACSFVASMTSVVSGYDTAVMSGAILFIREQMSINDAQSEILMGIINIYSLVGSTIAGRTSDLIGRRYTIVCASVIFFVGALLMAFATNYAFLMVGRFVAGIGVGFALMIAPVYSAEVSSASTRGFFTSFPEVFINFGVLLGYVANLAFAGLSHNINWRVMLGVGCLPAVGLGVSVLFMPESPRWLIMQGRLGEAKKVLAKTCDSQEEADLRLSEIKEAAGIPEDCTDDIVQVPKLSHGKGVWRELLIRPKPAVRRVLIASIGIHFFQQASGIDTVVLYSPSIFKMAGIKSRNGLLGATVAVGFTKTIFVLATTLFVDRLGRRRMLLNSVTGMIISLVILASALTVVDRNRDKNITWAIALSITMVLTFVACFSTGLGPLPWVYGAEIIPLRLRAQGLSLGVGVNRLMSGLMGMTFISLYKAITIGGAFFLFTGITIVAWIFFYSFFPETKGKTLEELETLFEKPNPQQKNNEENGPVQLEIVATEKPKTPQSNSLENGVIQ